MGKTSKRQKAEKDTIEELKGDFPRIERAANLGELKLALVFDDGRIVLVDMAKTAKKGGVFAKLKDPKYFSRVRPIRSGRALAWPGELEFCADALYGTGVRKRRPKPNATPFDARVFELI